MQTYSRKKSQHFCLVTSEGKIYDFRLCLYMTIHVYNYNQNVVFGNVLNKGRLLVKEDGDICFINGIGGTVIVLGLPRNIAHILGWIFSMLFYYSKVLGLRSIPISSMVALTEFFHDDDICSSLG